MLSSHLMEYVPQNEKITQKFITSSFTPKRKPEDSYMKKNKKETKIHYIIPQHRDQTLVYFRALSNP